MDEQAASSFNRDLRRRMQAQGFWTDELLKLFAYGALAASLGAATMTFRTWPLAAATLCVAALIWLRLNWLLTRHLRIPLKPGPRTLWPIVRRAWLTSLLALIVLSGFAFHLHGIYAGRASAPAASQAVP